MTDIPLLWSSGARKEVMDLLRRLWSHGDEATREAVSTLLVAGPPEALLARLDLDRRTLSRDRRIFDRLSILQRLGEPPLTAALEAEAGRLRGLYPEWEVAEGERADFSTWMEFRVGPDTRLKVNDLARMEPEELAVELREASDEREGALENWREFAAQDPAKAVDVLQLTPTEPDQADIWVHGLWGLRDQARSPDTRNRLLPLLLGLPDGLLNQADVARAAADVLEVAAKARPSPGAGDPFWAVFDRVLAAAARDPDNAEAPERGGWVGLAINRSMGSLASAFFDALFGRGLKVGQEIPDDALARLTRLLTPAEPGHRPARVIAASRLSYLYAVDPDWTRAHLLSLFDWRDEVEATAAWQGFGWQPRIDERLWQALKPYFLPSFTPERLEGLGTAGTQLAAMLMLVGVEFGVDELPRDAARDAIRAMPERLKSEAAAWIASYLRDLADGAVDELSADDAWVQRVGPLLARVWPPEPDPHGRGVASQFARAIVALDETFPQALQALLPHLVRGSADMVLHELAASAHPERHPRETLTLLHRCIDIDQIWMANELRNILDRLRAAAPEIAEANEYRRLDERLRAAAR
ncbi:MAG: hypothetical protein K2X61_12150 [Caulobacteraceae bacterium]|nr:hypothetical protein [Caulobacteraceae bacterium]